jgi:hypothetical protein
MRAAFEQHASLEAAIVRQSVSRMLVFKPPFRRDRP